MNRRFWLIGIALIIVLPLVWWLASPLFINQTVDEAFPFDVPTAEEQEAMTPEQLEQSMDEIMVNLSQEGAMDDMSEESKIALEERLMAMAADSPDHEMAEAMPEAADEWEVVAGGSFQDADDFHKGSGTATVFQQGEARILRFENFSSTNGPDLHVLLVENISGQSSSELGDYIDLGSLKGNIGNQNYEIPADADLTQYEGVMIYCMPFHVVFSTAAFSAN